MVSASTGGAVAAFVYIESNKDVLFGKVYIVGAVAVVFTVVWFFVLTAAANSIMLLVGAVTTAVSGGIGWYTALNKKDDLVMMHAVAKFEEQLQRMKEAEAKLSAALDTMMVSGKEIDKLDGEIKAEQAATEGTIKSIQKINGEAMETDKRAAHEKILVALADIDGNRTFEASECERLLRLLCNMSGREPDDPDIEGVRAAMPPLNDPTISMTAKEMHKLLNDINAFDLIMEPPADEFLKFGFKSREDSARKLPIEHIVDSPGRSDTAPTDPEEAA